MAGLAHALVFPLGGEGVTSGRPWIVNMRPLPEELDVGLLRPVSFSLRDTETYVDPASIEISAGYANTHADGTVHFEQSLLGTIRRNLLYPLTDEEPALTLIAAIPNTSDALVSIKKASDNPERSTYFTPLQAADTGAFDSVMLSVLIETMTVSNDPISTGAVGPVIGLEMGPRNKGVYVFFKSVAGVKRVMLAGPLVPGVAQSALIDVAYDWSQNYRYSLIWNESVGQVQLFADEGFLVAAVSLSSVPQFGTTNPKHCTSGNYVGVYGIEGLTNDEIRIAGVAMTDDVGYPIRGTVRPNSFVTFYRAADFVNNTRGVDPRMDQISPWRDDDLHFADIDPLGTYKTASQFFQIAKVTTSPASSKAIYREEPGFLTTNTNGFCIDLRFFGTSAQRDGAATGMGLVICDGFNAFRVGCFQSGNTRYLGIQKSGGTDQDLADQFSVAYDWTVAGLIRFVVDGKQGKILLYDGDDLVSPILERVLIRSDYPAADDFGWGSDTPFIALGHFAGTATAGSFYLQDISYSHYLQVWEARNGKIPNDGSAPIVWTRTIAGAPVSPTNPVTDAITVGCGNIDTLVYSRSADTNAFRGGSVEARVQITDFNDVVGRSGDAVVLDDGVHAFVLTFSESEEGKFACIAVRADIGSFQEVMGFEDDGLIFSYRVDWTQPHVYRMERRPFDGLLLFVDGDPVPKLSIPESKISEMPSTLYSTPTVAFGHFLLNTPSTAKWSLVRTFFSTGFEISFKKNLPDSVLKAELFDTELIVLVEASDNDT